MSSLINYNKRQKIVNEESLRSGEIIPVGNYTILANKDYLEDGIYQPVFRKNDNPTSCYIDFRILKGEPENSIKLYIDNFLCSYTEKPKGEGLKMLVALANYIHKKAEVQSVLCSTIELIALPSFPSEKNKKNKNNLINLITYYQSIGFKCLGDETNDTEEKVIADIKKNKKKYNYGVLMEADFNSFLEKHNSLLTGGKKRYISKKCVKKRNYTHKKT